MYLERPWGIFIGRTGGNEHSWQEAGQQLVSVYLGPEVNGSVWWDLWLVGDIGVRWMIPGGGLGISGEIIYAYIWCVCVCVSLHICLSRENVLWEKSAQLLRTSRAWETGKQRVSRQRPYGNSGVQDLERHVQVWGRDVGTVPWDVKEDPKLPEGKEANTAIYTVWFYEHFKTQQWI